LRKAAKSKDADAYAEWIKPLREAQKVDDLKEFKKILGGRLTKELDWNNGVILQQKEVIMTTGWRKCSMLRFQRRRLCMRLL